MTTSHPGMFACDLCGEEQPDAYRNKLFLEYRAPEVIDVCGSCHSEIQAAWRNAKRITDGLLSALIRRAIRRMRLKRRTRSHDD